MLLIVTFNKAVSVLCFCQKPEGNIPRCYSPLYHEGAAQFFLYFRNERSFEMGLKLFGKDGWGPFFQTTEYKLTYIDQRHLQR